MRLLAPLLAGSLAEKAWRGLHTRFLSLLDYPSLRVSPSTALRFQSAERLSLPLLGQLSSSMSKFVPLCTRSPNNSMQTQCEWMRRCLTVEQSLVTARHVGKSLQTYFPRMSYMVQRSSLDSPQEADTLRILTAYQLRASTLPTSIQRCLSSILLFPPAQQVSQLHIHQPDDILRCLPPYGSMLTACMVNFKATEQTTCCQKSRIFHTLLLWSSQ